MKKALILATILATNLQLTCNCDYVTAPSGLNVRAEKSTDSAVIEVLPFGAEVTPLKIGKKWTKLDSGFVSSEWISEDNPFDTMTYMGEWHITAYAETGYVCANGNYPTEGYTIACNSLPFGTEVYIEGVGFRTVEDRGPEWLGESWCDLYLGQHDQCVQWGSQYRKVWVK